MDAVALQPPRSCWCRWETSTAAMPSRWFVFTTHFCSCARFRIAAKSFHLQKSCWPGSLHKSHVFAILMSTWNCSIPNNSPASQVRRSATPSLTTLRVGWSSVTSSSFRSIGISMS